MATTPGDPYALPFPSQGDVADVPEDFRRLTTQLTTVLNKKIEEPAARVIFQTKVKVVTSVPTSAAGYVENDVIFVIA